MVRAGTVFATVVTAETIARAAERLAAAGGPGTKVILFGSHARGDAGPHSDLDFLVIEPEVPRRHAEMVRLRRELRGIPAPIDVLVYSQEQVRRYERTWGHVVRRALEEGQQVAAA